MSYKIAVAVLVENNDQKYLLIENHRRGWEFPGGYIEKNEGIQDAAIREVKEETGIDIKLIQFLGLEQDMKRSVCVFIFKGVHESGQLVTCNESKDIGYFTLDEALNLIKLQHFKERIIRCLDDEKIPFVINNGQ